MTESLPARQDLPERGKPLKVFHSDDGGFMSQGPFTTKRSWAFSSISIIDESYAFEGQPDLEKIDEMLIESSRDKQLFCTVIAARTQGYPAVILQIDGPTLKCKKGKKRWKEAVRQLVTDLEYSLGNSNGYSVINFSDGTSCRTYK